MIVIDVGITIGAYVDRSIGAVSTADPGTATTVFIIDDRSHGTPQTGTHLDTGGAGMNREVGNRRVFERQVDPAGFHVIASRGQSTLRYLAGVTGHVIECNECDIVVLLHDVSRQVVEFFGQGA